MSSPAEAPRNAALGPHEDLRLEMEKRKAWFFECQLRFLNLDSFRNVTSDKSDPRLDLISEAVPSWSFPGPIGGRMTNLGPVYLDSQEKVWTEDENSRRDAFAAKFIGRIDNWLGYKSGRRLAGEIAKLRKLYEQSVFASQVDFAPELNRMRRRSPTRLGPQDPGDGDCMGRAISRAMLAQSRPWLIPELYNGKNPDSTRIENWIGNLETFVSDFASELGIAVGGIAEQPSPVESLDTSAYRAFVRTMLDASTTRNVGQALKSKMLMQVVTQQCVAKSWGSVPPLNALPPMHVLEKATTYHYDIQIETSGYRMGPVAKYPFSDSVKYWVDVFHSSLGEAYVNKPNADMGLCHIMRTVYLLGTLPASLGKDDELTWRKRVAPGDDFAAFFAKKAADPALEFDPSLGMRMTAAQVKLQVILEETASNRRSAAATFSPLAQEVVRQALHSFKFWLDEALHVSDNDKLVKARGDTGIVDGGEVKAEMEYWSENHYIMFASSEFLAGQLWAADEFQPAKEFLDPDSKSGILSGRDRMARGKARVLKWLNNRLQFGWMEFNSSGYYREHLWALLNLADFSLDKEVRDKATLAIDLMLFDVARFLHKGTMGAAGGRSQFKSKSSGWDNALCDVVEIVFGSRGIFSDGDGQIGSSLATSMYQVPDVLLEIGCRPPQAPFVDRTRVSVSFEEAPKYGIGYSRASDQKDSLMQGYAAKRARHFPFVDAVNQELARTHSNYGATEDDTIFWWGTSAFYNKQIVRHTFEAVNKFGLAESGVFHGAVPKLIRIVSGYEKIKHRALVGGLIGTVVGPIGTVAGALIGAAEGLIEEGAEVLFKDDELLRSLEEAAADDLSVLIEGSTRTRANIMSYRSPEVMLSSIQNFRPGQLNFQSSVCQASLNPAVNVFTTAGLEDIDISNLDAAIGGGLIGAAIGAGLNAATGGSAGILVAGLGLIGGAVGTIGNEVALTHSDTLVDHEDGPGWWSGSWALPMVVQHRSAAILAYDFHTIQELLAKTGSHAWFPKAGFDRVDEVRTSAYDDANFPLLDITHIGRKGFWLFGKIVHAQDGDSDPGEAYVGVFSNQRPKWLDQDSDFYAQMIKETARIPVGKAGEDIESFVKHLDACNLVTNGRDVIDKAVQAAIDKSARPGISTQDWMDGVRAILAANATIQPDIDEALQLAQKRLDLRRMNRVWPDPLPQDYFAGRDWYVEGKNIWIIQVGGRSEFGNFDNFKKRVSSARVHLDDSGDMECSYDIPLADGGSERLTLAYGDGGRFGLDGGPLVTDLYPRFENPFVRGGRVAWGQREYVIEYNGASLLHDFSNYAEPLRQESPKSGVEERNLVKALVIFVRTGDEDMDAFTVANADVGIGCARVTHDQVIAAGPVDNDSDHDAEWIFFDFPVPRDATMTLSITHPASTEGADTPHWKMSFKLCALMGDRMLRPCTLSGAAFEFVDNKRTAPRFRFSIALFEWRPWVTIPDHKSPVFWQLAKQPDFTRAFFDYSDLIVIDTLGQMWHRRLMSCAAAETGWHLVGPTGGVGVDSPDWSKAFLLDAVSVQPSVLFLAVQSRGTLFARQPSPQGDWTAPWSRLDVWVYPDAIFGIPDTSGPPVPVALSALSPVAAWPSTATAGAVDLMVLAADANFYSRTTYGTPDTGPWRRIDVTGFSPLFGVPFEVGGHSIFALASDRSLWAAQVDVSDDHVTPQWEKLSASDFAVRCFAVTCLQGAFQIVVVTTVGGVRAMNHQQGVPSGWVLVNLPGTAASLTAPLAATTPSTERAMFFATGADSKVYTLDWMASLEQVPPLAWAEVAIDGKGVTARNTAGLAAVSRVSGQAEVYAQTSDGGLSKAWWS